MLKLIKLDAKLLWNIMIFRIFYIFFILAFGAMIPFVTHEAIIKKSSEIILDQSIFFLCNILTFLTISAPISKNNVSKIGGDYTKVVFSLPHSRRIVLSSKYLSLLILSTIITVYLLLLSSVTFLVMGKAPTLSYTYALIFPVFSSILIFGSLYLLSFFITKYNSILSGIIYFVSMMSFMLFGVDDKFNFLAYRVELLLFSVLLVIASYVISTISCKYRSF